MFGKNISQKFSISEKYSLLENFKEIGDIFKNYLKVFVVVSGKFPRNFFVEFFRKLYFFQEMYSMNLKLYYTFKAKPFFYRTDYFVPSLIRVLLACKSTRPIYFIYSISRAVNFKRRKLRV